MTQAGMHAACSLRASKAQLKQVAIAGTAHLPAVAGEPVARLVVPQEVAHALQGVVPGLGCKIGGRQQIVKSCEFTIVQLSMLHMHTHAPLFAHQHSVTPS